MGVLMNLVMMLRGIFCGVVIICVLMFIYNRNRLFIVVVIGSIDL